MNKRLLFITPIFPKNIEEDNVVPFISQFTKRFALDTAIEIEIDIITLMYPFTTEKYSIANINIYPLGSNFIPFFRQIPFLFRAVLKGTQLNKEHKYDGILCFWYRESALVGRILNLILHVKQIVWMHGQDVKKSNKFLKILKISVENMVMISTHQKKYFYKNCGIYVDKIANVAVDKKQFPTLNKGERKFDVIGIGNLGNLKNYSLFIEIISQLNNKNLRILIIGDGEEKTMLLKKIATLGLSENITLTGSLPHHEVLKHLNDAKVFLHTSKFEGNSTVIQEALYSGCKVVSTIEIETTFYIDDNFYYNTDKNHLTERIDRLLHKKLIANRIENFRMEDTIQVIYDMFYNDRKTF